MVCPFGGLYYWELVVLRYYMICVKYGVLSDIVSLDVCIFGGICLLKSLSCNLFSINGILLCISLYWHMVILDS